jgi:hypothetical protein
VRPPEGPWSAAHQGTIPFLRETVGWVIIWEQPQACDIYSAVRARPLRSAPGLIHGPNNLQSMVTVTSREPAFLSARAPAHATHKRGYLVTSLKFSAGCYNHLSDTLNSADLGRLRPLAFTAYAFRRG